MPNFIKIPAPNHHMVYINIDYISDMYYMGDKLTIHVEGGRSYQLKGPGEIAQFLHSVGAEKPD